eukprot:2421679-Pleurochrysis_carterae.AAC.1
MKEPSQRESRDATAHPQQFSHLTSWRTLPLPSSSTCAAARNETMIWEPIYVATGSQRFKSTTNAEA